LNKILAGIAGGIFALGISTAVDAKTFSFTWTSTDSQLDLRATETLSDTQNSTGGYNILQIVGGLTGSDGGGITGLITNPNQPYISLGGTGPWNFNNVAYEQGPILDNAGVLFTIGNYQYNLYTVNGGSTVTYYLSSNDPYIGYNPGTPGVVSFVPEISPWAMMLFGFICLSYGYFNKEKSSTCIH
jgi:hypothetical protein